MLKKIIKEEKHVKEMKLYDKIKWIDKLVDRDENLGGELLELIHQMKITSAEIDNITDLSHPDLKDIGIYSSDIFTYIVIEALKSVGISSDKEWMKMFKAIQS